MRQVHLNSMKNALRIKFGVRIPRNYAEAMDFDRNNGNTKWAGAEKLELNNLYGYESFECLGSNAPTPLGHTNIRCNIIYYAKKYGSYKARFVSGCHMTGMNEDIYYSSIVSLREILMVIFLAEMKSL